MAWPTDGNPTPASPPAATSPPPAAPAPASPPPPASPPTVPASGPGTSGTVPASGTTNPTPAVPQTAPVSVPGFNAGSSPATQATQPTMPAAAQQPDFGTQFQQQFGMGIDQAKLLLSMGYQAYQRAGQPASPPPAAAQPPTPANPFGLPQFDHRLLSLVGKDQNGNLVPLPGAPPDAVVKIQEYQEAFRKAQQDFFTDPMKALAPLIQQEAQKVAQQLYQQQYQQQQTATFAEQTVQENKDWLFEKNAQGGVQMRFDPATGREVAILTPLGNFYNQQLLAARQSGIENPQARHQYAIAQVQNALYQQRLQQLQAPAAGQQAAQQFVQTQAQHPPAAAPAPAVIPVQPTQTSLRDAMRASFQQNGLSDDAVVQQINRRAG